MPVYIYILYIHTIYTTIYREFARVGATKKHMRGCRCLTRDCRFFTSTRIGSLEQFFTGGPFDNKIRYQPWLG